MTAKKYAGYRMLLPEICALAWPTMLEQLMQTAVQYIDTAMVGALGTYATAAVGATSTVSWLVGSTISAIGVGFLSFVARAFGAGDIQRGRRAASQCILAVLVCGIFFTVLTLGVSRQVPVWMQVDPQIQDLAARYFFILYSPMLARTAIILFGSLLRSVGDTQTPMRIGILMNGVNVVLNFLLIYPSRRIWGIFIYGAGMGVVGAAIASAISFVVGGVCITIKLWNHPMISPKGQSWKPDWAILKPCLQVAFPNALQRFGTSLGYVAFASMINSIGDVATAAHTIANTVESAFYIPGYGMQTAAATLTGNALGAGDNRRIQELSRVLVALEVGLMIVSGGLLFAFAPTMMSLFYSWGHDAGNGEDPAAVCIWNHRYVGRSDFWNIHLYPSMGFWPGCGLGLYDCPQSAGIFPVFGLLSVRTLESYESGGEIRKKYEKTLDFLK